MNFYTDATITYTGILIIIYVLIRISKIREIEIKKIKKIQIKK